MGVSGAVLSRQFVVSRDSAYINSGVPERDKRQLSDSMNDQPIQPLPVMPFDTNVKIGCQRRSLQDDSISRVAIDSSNANRIVLLRRLPAVCSLRRNRFAGQPGGFAQDSWP